MKKIFLMPIFAGVLCIAGTNLVYCIVTHNGQINLKTCREQREIIPHKSVPFLRGIELLFWGGIYYIKALIESFLKFNYKMMFSNKNFIKYSLLASLFVVIALLLLVTIPPHMVNLISHSAMPVFFQALIFALIKTSVLFGVFYAVKFVYPFNMFYKFNAAGNAVLNLENENCGKHKPTNFLNFVVFALLIACFMLSLITYSAAVWVKLISIIIILPFAFGLSFEINNFIEEKCKQLKFITLVSSVLVTATWAKTESETAAAACLEGKLMLENNKRELIDTSFDGKLAMSVVYTKLLAKLHEASIMDDDELKWIVANVLGVKKLDIRFVTEITREQAREMEKAVIRRINGEPIAKIFGYVIFYGMKFKVNKQVLTPRQETELLVEHTLKLIGENNSKVLDLCSGSGAIAISIAKNSNAIVTAVDISAEALTISRHNASNNNVEVTFKESDLFSKLKRQKFDIIVSNPPYIKTEDIPTLAKEVREHDPHLALDGGVDGLYFYKKIIAEAPRYLNKNGKILFEIGINQAQSVKKLLTDCFKNIKIIRDYNKIQRIIIAELK